MNEVPYTTFNGTYFIAQDDADFDNSSRDARGRNTFKSKTNYKR